MSTWSSSQDEDTHRLLVAKKPTSAAYSSNLEKEARRRLTEESGLMDDKGSIGMKSTIVGESKGRSPWPRNSRRRR